MLKEEEKEGKIMSKRYHKDLKSIIYQIGNYYKSKNKLIRISRESPLYITHPSNTRIKPLTYTPDITFKTKDKLIYAFQILDTQASKEREIIADTIRACLTRNIAKLYFIVHSKEHMKRVDSIANIIWTCLVKDLEVNKNHLPEIRTIFIKKNTKFNKIKNKFKEIGKKDRW